MHLNFCIIEFIEKKTSKRSTTASETDLILSRFFLTSLSLFVRTGGVSDPIWPSFSEENYILSLYSSNSSSLDSERSMKMETGRLEKNLPTVKFWLQDFSKIRKEENYEEPICEQEENSIRSTNPVVPDEIATTPKSLMTTTVATSKDVITTINGFTTKNYMTIYKSPTTSKNVKATTTTPLQDVITTIDEFSSKNNMTTTMRTTAETLIETNGPDSSNILKFSCNHILFLVIIFLQLFF